MAGHAFLHTLARDLRDDEIGQLIEQ